MNSRTKAKKESKKIKNRILTDLEKEIIEFTKIPFDASFTEEGWKKTHALLKERAEQNSTHLHPVFFAILNAGCARCASLTDTNEKVLTVQIYGTYTLENISNVDKNCFEFRFYKEIVKPCLDEAIQIQVDRVIILLQDRLLSKILAILYANHDKQKTTTLVISTIQNASNEEKQKFHVSMHDQLNTIEILSNLLLMLHKISQEFKINEFNTLTFNSVFFIYMIEIVNWYYVECHYDVIKQDKTIFDAELTKKLQEIYKIHKRDTSITLMHSFINTCLNNTNFLVTKSCQLSITTLACHFLMVNTKNLAHTMELLDGIDQEIITPLEKNQPTLESIFSIVHFRANYYTLELHTHSHYNEETALKIQKTLTDLLNSELDKSIAPFLHASHIASNLVLTCTKYHSMIHKVSKIHQKKSAGSSQDIFKLHNINKTQRIGSIGLHRTMMDDVTKILQKNNVSLQFFADPNYQIKPIPIVMFTGNYLTHALHLLPTVATFKPNGHMNQKTRTIWSIDLRNLARLYRLLSEAIDFFINHPDTLVNQTTVLEQLIHIKNDLINPRIKDIETETSLWQEAQAKPIAEITEKISNIDLTITRNKGRYKSKHNKHLITEQKELAQEFSSKTQYEDEVIIDDTESLEREIHQKATKAQLQEKYDKALVDFDHLYATSKFFKVEALEGIVFCKTKILSRELLICLRRLNGIARNPGNVGPRIAEECYADFDSLRNDYDILQNEYNQLKSSLQDSTFESENVSDAAPDIDATIQFLNQKKSELEDIIKLCYGAIKQIKESVNLFDFHNIMHLGFAKFGIHDEVTQASLITIGELYYIEKSHKFSKSQTKQIERCKEIYAAGKEASQEWIEDKKSFQALNLASKHMELLDWYHADPREVSAKNRDDANIKAFIRDLHLKPDDFFIFFRELIYDTQDKYKIIERWVSELINNKLSSRQPLQFSNDALSNFFYRALTSKIVTQYFKIIIALNLFVIFLPLDRTQTDSFSKKSDEIYNRISLIINKIALMPPQKRDCDRLIAHILAIILLETIPEKTLLSNFKAWYDPSEPISQTIIAFNLSERAQSILYAFLSGRLNKNKTITTETNPKIIALQKIVIKQVNGIIDRDDIETIPYYAIIYGSDSLKNVLEHVNYSPKDRDVMTNIAALDMPYVVTPIPHLKDLNMYYISDGPNLDKTISIRINTLPLFSILNRLDFTIHLIIFDIPTEYNCYLDQRAVHDLHAKELTSLLPSDEIVKEPTRLLRYLSVSINYSFGANLKDIAAIRNHFKQVAIQYKEYGENIMKPFFIPEQLLLFLSTKFVAKKHNYESFIGRAWQLGILSQIVPIPLSALPISQETFDLIAQKLKLIDTHVDGTFSNSNDLLSDILTSIFVVILDFTKRPYEKIEKTGNDLIIFYSHKADALKRLVISKLKHHYVAIHTKNNERLTTNPTLVFSHDPSRATQTTTLSTDLNNVSHVSTTSTVIDNNSNST